MRIPQTCPGRTRRHPPPWRPRVKPVALSRIQVVKAHFLDGVYFIGFDGEKQIFKRVNAPTEADLEAVLQQISTRLARMLVKAGVLTQDAENSRLTLDHLEANPMQQVQGHSITYRIAIGPQQGKKVFA